MSEKYYTVQDKINGAFSTVNESDYKPYDPASGGSSFDPSVLEPYAEIENVDASLALKADKTELENYTPYSEYEQTTDAVSALQNDIANVYTQAEVDDRINRIPKFNIAVIEELPTTDISTTTVYLKKIGDEAGNMYAEYIYVNDAWEKLGEQSVNLTDYAKISDVDASLDLKADKTSIPTKVSAFTNDVGYLTEHQSLTDYAKKTEIPDTTNFATKDEIPTIPSFKTINGEEITGEGNINIDITSDQFFNPNGSNPISGKGVSDILFKEYAIPADGASNPKYIKVSYTIDNTMQPASNLDGLTINIETHFDSSIQKQGTGKIEVTHNGSEWHVTGLSVTGTGLTGIYYSDSYAIFKVEGYTRAFINTNNTAWGPITPSSVITYYTYNTDIYDNPTLNNPTINGTIKAYDIPDTSVSDSYYMFMSNTRDNTIKKITIWDAIAQAEPYMVKSNKKGIKIWTGTQSEYDAITTKDDNTVYFVK